MRERRQNNPRTSDLSRLSLTPQSFDTFYKTLAGLRFPMNVAEVLELRYLINHTVDDFTEPPLTPDYRQFRDTLQTAIDTFSIENRHHRERLVKILTMLREIHYVHTVNTRDASERLRLAQTANRKAHRQSIHFGLFFLVCAILGGIAWLGIPDWGWVAKIATVVCAYFAWDFFHSLPTLDREMKQLTRRLHNVFRRHIRSVDWKTLIHKLSLVLGYKQISGVEVFRMDGDSPYGNPHHTRH